MFLYRMYSLSIGRGIPRIRCQIEVVVVVGREMHEIVEIDADE
jgi:hypothetical protein